MAFYNLIKDSVNGVPTIDIADIQNHITYICLADFVLSFGGKQYRLQKGDTVIAESEKEFTRYLGKLYKIQDPTDIIDIFLYVGKEGYLKVELNRDMPTNQVLFFNGTTKKFEFGVGGGGALSILDEGVIVNAATTTLNFIGPDVLAQQDGTNPSQVNIFIPPPSFVSHFHTSDGITNATLTNTGTTNRHVSSPTVEGIPFNLGTWSGDEIHSCTHLTTLNYSNAQNFSIFDLTTSLTINVIDADGVTILATHTLSNINGNTNVTSDNINIQISNWAVDSTKYQARATILVHMSLILPASGRFSIRMTHNDSTDGIFIYTQNNLFYDRDNAMSVITGVTMAETVGNVLTQFISGINHYDLGSQFTIDILDIDNINSDSYPTTQVVAEASGYGLPTLNITGSELTGWSDWYGEIDNTYQKTDWAITALEYYNMSNEHALATPKDWIDGTPDTSPNNEIIVCTFTDNATRVFDDFKLESLRLESDMVTIWDSTQDILIYDGSDGLQYSNSRLVYPTINYTTYDPQLPGPANQRDYSVATGLKVFRRLMWHTGTSHSNAMFRLSDYNITEAMLTMGDVSIEISLNNGVDWFDATTLYAGGALANGDGCRINADTHGLIGATVNDGQIEITLGLGLFTDAGSKWGFFIRISYADTVNGRSAYMGSFEIINWV